MMDMKDKIFAVDDVSLHDLEEHLNEMAQDDWVLHSIYQINADSSLLPYFTVITYRPYDWEAHVKKHKEEWEAKLKAEGDAAAGWEATEKWQTTVGVTSNTALVKKLHQKSKGHANE